MPLKVFPLPNRCEAASPGGGSGEPRLEELWLNADDRYFQQTPIDQGVLALGECRGSEDDMQRDTCGQVVRHCHKLMHLDLYDRWIQAGCFQNPLDENKGCGVYGEYGL